MKMVGHKTESIYRRYAIADEKSMKQAAGKLDQFYVIDQQPTKSKYLRSDLVAKKAL